MTKQIPLFIASFFFVCLLACNTTSTEQEDNPTNTTTIDENTLLVEKKSAVIFDLADDEIEKIKEEYPEDVYAEIFSDIGFYMAEARSALEAKGIEVITTSKEKIIFRQKNGTETKVVRRESDYDMVLFRPDTFPIMTYSADYEQALGLIK